MTCAKVLFATITGNNEDIADIVAEELEKHNVDVEVLDISQTDVSELNDCDICVVCPYTYDGGSLPDEGLDFFDDLTDVKLPNLIFGVAGSGDEFYGDDFCKAVDKFAAAFRQTGATCGAKNVKINLAPDSSEDLAALAQFASSLVDHAKKNE